MKSSMFCELAESSAALTRRTYLNGVVVLLAVIGCLGIPRIAFAANTTDTFTNGAGTYDLGNASNWSLTAIPGSTNDAVFASSGPAGTLTFKSTSTFGSINDLNATAITINPNSPGSAITLTLGGASSSNGVAPSATDWLYVASGANLTIGAGASLSSTGTLSLSVSTAGNFDNAGTLTIDSALASSAGLAFTGGGVTTINGFWTIGSSGVSGASTGTLVLNGGGSSSGNFGSVGAGGVLTLGEGTFTESGTGAAVFYVDNELNVDTGAILDIAGTATFRLSNLSGGTQVDNLNGGEINVTSTGSGAFTGHGGAFTLNLNSGTLATSQAIATAVSGSSINFNGATWQATASVADLIAANPGNVTLNVQSGGAVINVTSGNTLGIAENLVHSTNGTDGGLTSDGVGTLTLSGKNTYNGITRIQGGGTLIVGSASVGVSSESMTSNATTSLTVSTTGLVVGEAVSGAYIPIGDYITAIGSGNVTLATAATGSGSFTGTFGGYGALGVDSAVSMDATAGSTLDLTSSNTIGSLTGGGAGVSVTLGTSILTLGSDNTSPAPFAGVISGVGGGLTKIGSGTEILSGANTYSGATTVNAGVLSITGSLASGSTVSVAANTSANAILSGSGGTIGGAVTVGSGVGAGSSIIEVGASGNTGTLILSGGVIFGTNSKLSFQLNSNSQTIDLFTITGSLSLGSGVAALVGDDLGSTALGAGTVFTLATTSGGITGNFIGYADGSDITIGDNTFQINYGTLNGYSNDLTLDVVAVPEPSSWRLLILSFAAYLSFILMKRKGLARI